MNPVKGLTRILLRIRASIKFRTVAAGKRARRFVRSAAARRRRGESKFLRFTRDLEQCSGSLLGKRILEVGSDSERLLLESLVRKGGAALAIGVNPAAEREVTTGRAQLFAIDARSMPFESEYFDVIASLSVLEHVHDLDAVLAECYRVLAPGGSLFAEFGPIWSSAWGHHLWLYHGGEVVDWNSHPLPPYAHLLMSREQIEDWCVGRFGDRELAGKIAAYVTSSPDQNRLFFSDYVDIARSSPFELVFACGVIEIPFPPHLPGSDLPATFAELARRFPSKSGFGYHVVRMMLRKPPYPAIAYAVAK